MGHNDSEPSPEPIPSRDIPRAAEFVSYAQNFEDVRLWRALARYGPGFYLDVGAGEPDADSVTQAFYLAGWRGIDVEPMMEPYERLRAARPRDVVLNVAIEERPSPGKTYYSVDAGNGLSTGVSLLAEKYRVDGRDVRGVTVPVMTLAEIWERFVDCDVYFLKIDVEGSEESVLRGGDFDRHRPWIVLVESTEAATAPAELGWHDQLVKHDYRFACYDGINRYYVAAEKAELLIEPLAAPVGWLDNVVTAEQAAARADAAGLRARMDALLVELDAHRQTIYEDSRLIAALNARTANAEADRDRIADELARLQAAHTDLVSAHTELNERYSALGHANHLLNEQYQALGHANHLLNEQYQALGHAHHELTRESTELHRRVAELRSSTSWRFTRPLRFLSSLLSRKGSHE